MSSGGTKSVDTGVYVGFLIVPEFPTLANMIWPIVGVVFWWMSGAAWKRFAARKIETQRISLIELALVCHL
jgi:hypothetical protein